MAADALALKLSLVAICLDCDGSREVSRLGRCATCGSASVIYPKKMHGAIRHWKAIDTESLRSVQREIDSELLRRGAA